MIKLRVLLDTNICIYVNHRRHPQASAMLASYAPGEVGISTITWGELRFGAEKSDYPKANLARLTEFAQKISVLPLNESAGIEYGRLRASLESAGTPIGANDLWIAAHALSLDVTLVTANAKEFRRVKGLRVENWAG